MSVFQVDITKDGNCYPDEVIVKIDKERIFIRELKGYIEKYPNEKDLIKVLKKLIEND